MRDYIELGPAPTEESCAQVGEEDYHTRAREECLRYIALIRQTCGVEPEGAQLRIKTSVHDFGSYKEVACYYEDTNEQAVDYAWNLDKHVPVRWEN